MACCNRVCIRQLLSGRTLKQVHGRLTRNRMSHHHHQTMGSFRSASGCCSFAHCLIACALGTGFACGARAHTVVRCITCDTLGAVCIHVLWDSSPAYPVCTPGRQNIVCRLIVVSMPCLPSINDCSQLLYEQSALSQQNH